MVSFPDAIKLAFSQYAKFDGRATRAEYWWYFLFVILGYLASFLVGAIFDVAFSTSPAFALIMFYGFGLGNVIPMWAITSRRLHDIGQSGWVQVIQYIPCVSIVGFWVMIYLCCKNSSTGVNQYGPDPRGDLKVNGSYSSEASYFDETVVEKSADDSGSDEKQCRICNVSNKPNSTFCKQCGKHLGDAT